MKPISHIDTCLECQEADRKRLEVELKIALTREQAAVIRRHRAIVAAAQFDRHAK